MNDNKEGTAFHPLLEVVKQSVVAEGFTSGVQEYQFASPRRWRFDLAWPDLHVAFEYEGGQFARGRHMRPEGYANDCQKYNRAALEGWLVIRATRSMIEDGSALRDLFQALKQANDKVWDDVAGVHVAKKGEERKR